MGTTTTIFGILIVVGLFVIASKLKNIEDYLWKIWRMHGGTPYVPNTSAEPGTQSRPLKKTRDQTQIKLDEERKKESDPARKAFLLNEDGKSDARKTILFIDDDRLLLNMYGRKSAEAGFNTYTLTTANGDIVQKVVDIQPDLISLDIIMAGRDGFDAMKMLKADNRTKDIPVIFLTNESDKPTIEMAQKLGAVDYIVCAYIIPTELIEKYSSYLKDPKSYKRWIDYPTKDFVIE